MLDVALLLAGIVALVVVGGGVASRAFRTRFQRVRPATDEERAAFDSLASELGPAIDQLYVVETVGEASIEVAIRGPPRYRAAFVSDYVLDELDEETARALIAAERGRATTFYTEYRLAAIGAILLHGIAVSAAVIPFSIGVATLIVGAFVVLSGGRTLQYRADSRAAEVVGSTALADAFETAAAIGGTEAERGDWRRLFAVQPPLGDRIDHLRMTE